MVGTPTSTRGWLCDGTQVQSGEAPRSLVADGDLGHAKAIARDCLSPVSGALRLRANRDGDITVHANDRLFAREGLVAEVAGAMALEPLVAGEHEAERSDGHEVGGEQRV